MLRSSDPRISGWINPETTFRATKECLWPHGDNDLVHTLPASEWWSSCADWWPNCRHFSWEEKTTSPWITPEMMEMDALQGTNISPQKWQFEDDFPFPKMGYVNSLEGTGIRWYFEDKDRGSCLLQSVLSLQQKCGVFFLGLSKMKGLIYEIYMRLGTHFLLSTHHEAVKRWRDRKKYTWNPKHPLFNGCFSWMIPNLYILQAVVSPNIH